MIPSRALELKRPHTKKHRFDHGSVDIPKNNLEYLGVVPGEWQFKAIKRLLQQKMKRLPFY